MKALLILITLSLTIPCVHAQFDIPETSDLEGGGTEGGSGLPEHEDPEIVETETEPEPEPEPEFETETAVPTGTVQIEQSNEDPVEEEVASEEGNNPDGIVPVTEGHSETATTNTLLDCSQPNPDPDCQSFEQLTIDADNPTYESIANSETDVVHGSLDDKSTQENDLENRLDPLSDSESAQIRNSRAFCRQNPGDARCVNLQERSITRQQRTISSDDN